MSLRRTVVRNQPTFHTENLSEIHLRLVRNIESTGLITEERNGCISARIYCVFGASADLQIHKSATCVDVTPRIFTPIPFRQRIVTSAPEMPCVEIDIFPCDWKIT